MCCTDICNYYIEAFYFVQDNDWSGTSGGNDWSGGQSDWSVGTNATGSNDWSVSNAKKEWNSGGSSGKDWNEWKNDKWSKSWGSKDEEWDEWKDSLTELSEKWRLRIEGTSLVTSNY